LVDSAPSSSNRQSARGDGNRRGGEPVRGRDLRARGKRTLERLLEAGATVFEARGYHAARVDDIVKAANTSHGTFYLYFASKEDLFHALALDVAEAMVALARELPVLAPGADGFLALRAWLERFHLLYARHAPMIRSWTEAEIVESEMGKIGGDLVVQFSREVAVRLRHAAPDLDPDLAALALVAMIERSNYYLATRQVRVAGGEMVEMLARVTHAGLFGLPVASLEQV
jgi:AcrR family transcriptional regulator